MSDQLNCQFDAVGCNDGTVKCKHRAVAIAVMTVSGEERRICQPHLDRDKGMILEIKPL